MKSFTQSLHTKVDTTYDAPAVTPIYQNSAFEAHSEFFYTRKNNPNIQELEDTVAVLAEANHALATTTGMSAISIVLNLLKPGQHLVINKYLYGCSYKLFQWFCENYKIKLSIEDLSDKDNWDKIEKADMVLFETPTNPFLYNVNIQAFSDIMKAKNTDCLIVVDNTWATPLYQKPCNCGADISLHSATKYFGGHSDVMGGMLVMNNTEIYEKLKSLRFYFGAILAPFSAWLIKRSLQTMEIRLEKHHRTTVELVEFLKARKEITEVFYPEIDGKQLTSYATLVFFTLAAPYKDKYKDFSQSLNLFSTGTGMACVTSMVAQPYNGSHASMCDEEKAEMGLDESLVRLSFGLEDVADLKSDLANALDNLSS